MSGTEERPYDEEYEDEIDFIAIFRRILQKKVFIAKITVLIAVVGLVFAFSSPREYKSECVFFPQSSNQSSSGGLASLAALAGVNIGDMTQSSQLAISPNLYPQILENDRFIKELMHSEVYFKEFDKKLTLFRYFTAPEYRKDGIGETVMKYTVGLPGLIMKAVRGKEALSVDFLDTASIVVFTPKENRCAQMLRHDVIKLEVDAKKGYITISAKMGDPFSSAQVAQLTFELLQKYVTSYRTSKAMAYYNYLDKLCQESKMEYDSLIEVYAKYLDTHRDLASKSAMVEQVRLRNNYELADGVYQELGKQKVQAGVRVKENTPILIVVKPVSLPSRPSNMSKSKVLVIGLFLGVVLGCAAVLGFDFMKKNGMGCPAGWHTQEEDEEEERKILESGLVPDSFWKKFFSKKLFV